PICAGNTPRPDPTLTYPLSEGGLPAKWLYTIFAQPRRPRSWFPFADSARSHSRTGMPKPVLGRERIALGKGRRGASNMACLPGGRPSPSHSPTERSNSMSTRAREFPASAPFPPIRVAKKLVAHLLLNMRSGVTRTRLDWALKKTFLYLTQRLLASRDQT